MRPQLFGRNQGKHAAIVRCAATVLATLIASCDHPDAFAYAPVQQGPISQDADTRLTLNSDQDSWPVWSEDRTAITYAYVDSTQAQPALYGHRCIGALPAGGGTRLWEWCDNRATAADSALSFPAFALGSDGRLLYLESVSPSRFTFVPEETTLWIADTAHPFRRRAIARLPIAVGDSVASWLADLNWIGPTTFLGLAQHWLPASHCRQVGPSLDCSAIDSVFNGEMVFTASTTASGPVFKPVAGTDGATAYSIAENRTSIVFTQRNNLNLMKVPFGGGQPVIAARVTERQGVQLLGVSCEKSTCVVALGPVTLWAPAPDTARAAVGTGDFELRSISLAGGRISYS